MRAWLPAGLALALLGCSSSTTVLLTVDGDLAPGSEIEALSISATQEGRTLWVGTVTLDADDALPYPIVIRPDGRPEGAFELRVAARRQMEDLVAALRQSEFRPGREVTERVCLLRRCVASPTAPGCAEGLCASPDGDGDADTDLDADACEPSAELCNGVDDDCDPGTADGAEDPAVGLPCDGEDADPCEEGVTICVGGAVECGDYTGDSVESCNGLDDDCDGVIDDEAGCPCAQAWLGDHSYLFCSDLLGWSEARDFCLRRGYDLVAVDDDDENAFVGAETSAVSATASFWIGLTDELEEGTFVWVATGEVAAFTSWGPGQPDDWGEGEDCAETNDDSTPELWNDSACTATQRFVCEAG